MHGDKKNGANREENAVFAAFCITESGTAAFHLREQKHTGKGEEFCPERR